MLLCRRRKEKAIVDLAKLKNSVQEVTQELKQLGLDSSNESELLKLKGVLESQYSLLESKFKQQLSNVVTAINDIQFHKAVEDSSNTVEIYTDGGARGNGKEDCVCAWAYYMLLPDSPLPVEQSFAGVGATNQRMELIAILQAMHNVPLNLRKGITVNLYSDSAYCINTLNDYIHRWVANGWTKSKGEIAHLDAWKQVYMLMNSFEDINFIKVKGHSTNSGNNAVDALVNKAMDDYIKEHNL